MFPHDLFVKSSVLVHSGILRNKSQNFINLIVLDRGAAKGEFVWDLVEAEATFE